MLRRAAAVLAAALALVAASASSASAATTACRPGAGSPSCLVWTGKVDWVPDGDTVMVDIAGDGTSTPVSVRVIGIQAMEQTVYAKVPAKRRGECHALAATARVEYLIKRGGGKVRLTAQYAGSHSDVRNRPQRSLAVNLNGSWYDIGRDLIRNGYVMWQPASDEYAWNPVYGAAAKLAARDGRNMYDSDACGTGPAQAAKLSLTVNYDAEGDDGKNVNGEWIRIDNASTTAVSLAKWWVRDSGLRRYTFPAGSTVAAGGSVWVHVGKGTATATHKYWGLTAPIFSNPTPEPVAMGDGGFLFDPQGDLRAAHIY